MMRVIEPINTSALPARPAARIRRERRVTKSGHERNASSLAFGALLDYIPLSVRRRPAATAASLEASPCSYLS